MEVEIKMTIKSAIKRTIASGLVALTCLAGSFNANAQDLRARVENQDIADKNDTKTTLAIGNKGTEFFRVYNHDGDSEDFTSAALGNQYGTVFGSFGDKEGIAIEPTVTFGGTKITAIAEHSKTTDTDRFGAGIDQKVGNVTFGAGFDKVSSNEYGLVKAIVDFKSNQLGTAFRRNEETKDNSTIAFWCHYGKQEKAGTRTWVKYDWNDETQNKTVCFDSIIAQNPTLSAFSSPWLVGRGSTESGMYNPTVNENALGAERVPLNDRSKGGVVADISGRAAEAADGAHTGNLRLDAGYTFSETRGIKPGALAFYLHDISGDNVHKAGASALLKYKKFCLEATGTRNLADDKNDVYVSVTYCLPLGNQGGK